MRIFAAVAALVAATMFFAVPSASADGPYITIWSGPQSSGWSISSGSDRGACRPMYRPNNRPQPQRWDNRYVPTYPNAPRWGGSGDYMNDRPGQYDRRAIEDENRLLRDAITERERLGRAIAENERLRRALDAGCQRY